LTVQFAPSTTGSRDATLKVGATTVTLHGTGTPGPVGPRATVSPAAADFGLKYDGPSTPPPKQAGVTSPVGFQVVTLTNTGSASLTVTGATVTGPDAAAFQVASPATCTGCLPPPVPCVGSTLAPGHACQLWVSFQPTAVGPATATLSFADNAPNPGTLTLSGTGSNDILAVNPNPADFGAVAVGGSTTTPTLTVTNISNGLAGIGAVLDATPDYQLVATTCPTATPNAKTPPTLPPGGSCTLTVQFAPSTTGSRDATLKVGATTVTLHGTGTLTI
jgi:hypothetical protein